MRRKRSVAARGPPGLGMGAPNASAWPVVGASSPASTRQSVVLPEPLSPTRPVIVPGSMARETFVRAGAPSVAHGHAMGLGGAHPVARQQAAWWEGSAGRGRRVCGSAWQRGPA